MLDRWGWLTPDDKGWTGLPPKVLVDLKTGVHDPGHDIQTAIYEILLKHHLNYDTDIRMTIQLTKDGSYRKHVGKPRDKSDAISILNTYRWLQEHRRLPNAR